MARSFDSDDHPLVLHFTENLDCPRCGETFEAFFVDRSGSLSVQDLVEAPVGEHVCPWCEHMFTSEFSGWMFYSEAG
jgi:uncharacterized protein (UPF0212 family)